jgi:hypothetical protein
VGYWHSRVRGGRYDELIGAYVATATAMFPHAMLHWEDFGAANAHRILTKYAGTCRLCTLCHEERELSVVRFLSQDYSVPLWAIYK